MKILLMTIGNVINKTINRVKKSMGLLAVALLVTGCTSTMSHTGSTDIQYYPGTYASYQMLNSQQTSWVLKPFIILDMPFTIILDTLLLPWDSWRQQQSIKSQLQRLEKADKKTNIGDSAVTDNSQATPGSSTGH